MEKFGKVAEEEEREKENEHDTQSSEHSFYPDPFKHGELIVLGYNGAENHTLVNGDNRGRRHRHKMELTRRKQGNGIEKAKFYSVAEPSHSEAVKDRSKHTVSYTYNRTQTVIVEYQDDNNTDMFQIGRSSEPQIDFTVVDTWLAAGGGAPEVSRVNATKDKQQYSSTISRYACRILVDRKPPFTARVYAAGFDQSRNIFLGEKATKWQKKNGEVDGLTTNGILILHPNIGVKNGTAVEGREEMYVWREVSVDGDIYTLRETRSAQKRGDLVREESNVLQDGTLIDLCGATLLWRTREGLERSPTKEELEVRLDELNAGRPQCPVNLNTLIVPKRRQSRQSIPGVNGGAGPSRVIGAEGRRESAQSNLSFGDHQPYVYTYCGHVQGKHDWGHVMGKEGGAYPKHKCPMCAKDSERIIQLSMGVEPVFHLDSEALDHAFIPCGHLASLNTVKYWSRIPLPHGTNSFHPVCPFCTCLLSVEKPILKLIFQDHCDF